jgi:hypothetical protein
MTLSMIVICLLLSGCTLPTGIRKLTVWGFVLPGPIAVGYWHSEHGEGVQSEESAKPAMP